MEVFNDKLKLLCETNLENIREIIERTKPDVAVVDSIQTMFHEDITSAPGSVSQVRESTNVLMQIAKGMGVSIFYCRSRDKRGKCSRSPCAGAYGRYCALFRGRQTCLLPDTAGGEEPFWLH